MFSYLAVFHERALRIRGRDSLNLYVVGPSGTWRFAYFSHVDNMSCGPKYPGIGGSHIYENENDDHDDDDNNDGPFYHYDGCLE